ncbi:MAG: HAMP domain-containing sensor histidine kinase [Anaerolineales bacterium]
MNTFLGNVFALLTTPSGNLIYHLCLVVCIGGALQGAIHHWRISQFPQARRTLLGLAVLLGLQLLQFFFSALVWQGLLDPQTVLPPLDRAVSLLSLVWIAWLWTFPEPVRLADAAVILLTMLAVTAFGATLVFWSQTPGVDFNLSIFDLAWHAFSLAIILLSLVILLVRRPNGWGNGLAVLLLAFFGHLAGAFLPMAGDFPGALRLAHLALFPILLTLPQRFPLESSSSSQTAIKTDQQIPERRRYSTDPKTFHALLSLAGELDPGKISRAMTRGIAQAMLADLCFLLTLSDDKTLNIVCGYDLIREEALDGTTVDRDSIPLLANALQRGRPLRLPASSTSSDLRGLGQILGLTNPGHLLSVPINASERSPLGGLLLLSPYSNRLWSAEDQTYLTNVASLFVPILERSQRLAALEVESEKSRAAIEEARRRAEEAEKKYEEISQKYEALSRQAAQVEMQAENIAALLAVQEESQRTINQLRAELEQVRQGILPTETSSAQVQQLENELRLTLKEVARLQNALAQAEMKILELEKRPASAISNEQAEVIASISQELRQPMSSIVGYTDLLLGESVGILGALQRKFVERIKGSTERIGSLIEDLIQLTTLEAGRMDLKPEPVDINLIIDNAMAYTSTQIREKNITMRLDVPSVPPQIQTDREALQQILIHLLQNASAATPAEGTITLRVQMQKEKNQNYLLLQVSDTGGGISAEDIPRVFARRYRADNSLIQGLGDTGVGLSIAKTLVEAQHGRIWVETEAGVGSTFSVLLPVTPSEEKP